MMTGARSSWPGLFAVWAAGGIVGILEAVLLQNPVSSFSIVSDRSVYLFAFLVYGTALLIPYIVLKLLWNHQAPSGISRILIVGGMLSLVASLLYAVVPSYRLAGKKTANASAPPSFILLTLDTTRADHLGFYGYSRKTSPFLDSLSARSVVFENAYTTATWTLPAHVSLFTGLMPTVHGAGYENFFVSSSLQMLAETLGQKGYTTGAFIGGPFLVSAFNVGQGFEYYDEQLDPHSKLKRLTLFRVASRLLKRNLWTTDGQRRADEINRVLFPYLDWLKDRKPFFLFVNYFDPHEPYDPPESARKEMNVAASDRGYIRQYFIDKETGVAQHRDGTPITENEFRHMKDLYDAEIRFLDSQLSLLWRKLEENGLLNNTIVILTSDHGESIGEHQILDHGHALYQEQVRIPFMISGPAPWNHARRISGPVQIMDVYPTALHSAGIPQPQGLQGQSLLPLLTQQLPARPILAELDADSHPRFTAFNRSLKMILEQDIKLIESSRKNHELYDLAADPAESNNLLSEKSGDALRLHQQINRHFQVLEKMRHRGTGEIDAETREKLKALGYIE